MPCPQHLAPPRPIAAVLHQLADQVGAIADQSARGTLPTAEEIYQLIDHIEDARAQLLNT